MSSIYIFHTECPAIDSVASGDCFLMFDTSSGRTKYALASDLATFDRGNSLSSSTTTATTSTVTLNNRAGVITTESLSNTSLTNYVLTITNTTVTATDICFASLSLGSNTAGQPFIDKVTPGAGTLAISVANKSATALNGTVKLAFRTWAA